jgi:hypothetical protein
MLYIPIKLCTMLYISINCSLKVCDYDLCDACCSQLTPDVPAPPLGRESSTRLPGAVVSPFRGAPLALIPSHVRDLPGLGLPLPEIINVIDVSSDFSPPPPRIHPFFFTHRSPRAHVQRETHALVFHALARQPAVPVPAASPPPPPRRPAGRLKLRVSTPVLSPPAVHTASAPRRKHRPISSPIGYEYPDIAGLAISTPPRVGNSQFEPRLLFFNSPSPSPVHIASPSPVHVAHRSCQTDVAVAAARTSPQPLTVQDFDNLRLELQDLRNEVRTLVQAFGF